MALYLSPMAPHLAPGWRHPNPHPDPDPNPNPNPNQAGGIFSCIDKLFEWFPHAVRTYPGAAFYGKADDDSLVDVPRLVEMLRPAILTMAMLTIPGPLHAGLDGAAAADPHAALHAPPLEP